MGDTRRRKADILAALEKPATFPVNPDGIPAALKERPQWVCWRWVWRKDKKKPGQWTKVPYDANGSGNRGRAEADNPRTWAPFDQALATYRKGAFDGIGYMFAADDPFVGVDLDDCRDPDTGEVDAWGAELLAKLDSYAELSPTLTGGKVWVIGQKPGKECRRRYQSGEVEIYDRGRFFTTTGHLWGESPATINERGDQLAAVHGQVFGDQADDKKADRGERQRSQAHTAGDHGGGNGDGRLSDAEVLRKASRAKNADKFLRLWGGDTSGHGGDDSRADLALCCILAFYCRRDAEQMDRLFRDSGLMRDKWDEPRGDSTYGQQTIARAVEGCEQVYEPPVKVKGFRFPGKRKPAAGSSANGNGQPPPDGGQPSDDQAEEADGLERKGYGIILDYFRRHYGPVFRRGQVLYSGTLEREVKMGEACAAPGIELVGLLMGATNVPRNDSGYPDEEAIPYFFRNWCKSAWVDLLAGLPDEEAGAIVCSAEEKFHAGVAKALLHHAALGQVKDGGEGEETRVQRRTLLNWCRIFAKMGAWRDVRGYQVWCRKDMAGRLQVALRHGLFGQVQGCADIEHLGANKFTRLCELYAVGEGQKVKGSRAVVLSAEFLAWLEGQPAGEDVSRDAGQTHAGAREKEASKCPESDEPPGGQGVAEDTSRDTSAQDAQSVPGSVPDSPPF